MTTGVAGDLDPEPDGVLVVVDAHFDHLLDEAAGRALVPQALAAAAPIERFAVLDGFRQCLGIHVGVHQHLARLGGGGDHRYQSVGIEFGRELRAFLDLFDADALAERGLVSRRRWFS